MKMCQAAFREASIEGTEDNRKQIVEKFSFAGDFATASSTRSLKNSALAKNRGASHRNRTSPGNQTCIRISCDVVITFDAMGAPQHGGVWAPTVP